MKKAGEGKFLLRLLKIGIEAQKAIGRAHVHTIKWCGPPLTSMVLRVLFVKPAPRYGVMEEGAKRCIIDTS